MVMSFNIVMCFFVQLDYGYAGVKVSLQKENLSDYLSIPSKLSSPELCINSIDLVIYLKFELKNVFFFFIHYL
jgi:hypothetical protein